MVDNTTWSPSGRKVGVAASHCKPQNFILISNLHNITEVIMVKFYEIVMHNSQNSLKIYDNEAV